MRFKSVAVMPMVRVLFAHEQRRFTVHERIQKSYLSEIPALSAIRGIIQRNEFSWFL